MSAKLGVITAALRARANSLTVGLALAVVSAASGFISYTHICALTLIEGGSWKTAHLMPLAVDGQIVIGSVYFMENEGKRRRWLGLIGCVPGIAESLVANWESGIAHGLWAAGWDTVPAQAFACSAILFERWLHARKGARLERKSDAGRLADAMAEIAGLREAVSAAEALADSAGAALAAVPARLAPAGGPQPVPWPVLGPTEPVRRARAKTPRRPRPALVPRDPAEARPLPTDEAELAAAVNSMGRNDLVRVFGVTYHKAKQLREQYLSNGEEARVA